jgi:hypothetical protein
MGRLQESQTRQVHLNLHQIERWQISTVITLKAIHPLFQVSMNMAHKPASFSSFLNAAPSEMSRMTPAKPTKMQYNTCDIHIWALSRH